MSEEKKENTKSLKNHSYRNYKKFKTPDILGGTIFISLGVILLLNNFSVIPWSIWNYLIVFWPVIFIFIGLDLISSESWVLKIITSTIGLLIVLFIISYSLFEVDYSFRSFVYKNFPSWGKIYQTIPKKYFENSNNVNLNDGIRNIIQKDNDSYIN